MFKRKKPVAPVDPYGTAQPDWFKKPNWFKRHKKLTISLSIVAGVLFIGGSVAAVYFMSAQPQKITHVATPAPKPEPEPEPVHYYSPLTGAEVADQATTAAPVTGVMIENSPDARPQSGIKDSGVVFEAIAEGGITRFLVLYQEQKPQLIGPVRSVRMYYVDWLAAFNAGIAHVGGSAAALKEVRNGNYRDLDQFFNASTYWRATDRYAPHNVYTSFAKLDALNAKKGYAGSSFNGFTRKDSSAVESPSASRINVKISSALFNSSYIYNVSTNTYDRSQAGAPHKDREGGQISPRVVVVLGVTQTTVLEDGYRESITAIGSGKATIFQDGTVQEVTWHKAKKTDQITFIDAAGNDVPLARGQTWITAVPTNKGGKVTWQ